MTDRPEPETGPPAAASDEDARPSEVPDDDASALAVRALLKRSMSRDVDEAPDLLAGVQRRIRTRSRGKFFGDGWSTTQARVNYALVGLLTLLLVVLAYFVLSPIDVR